MKPDGWVLMTRKEAAIALAIVIFGGGIWGYAGGEPWSAIVARAIVTGVMYALVMGVYLWFRKKRNGL